MKKKLAIILENMSIKSQLEKFFSIEDDFELIKFNSMDDFYSWSKGQEIHGVLCEIKLTIKGKWEARQLLNLLDNTITVARLRWNSSNDQVVGIIKNQTYEESDFWDEFISSLRGHQNGRLLRKEERREKYWNVQFLSQHVEFSQIFFNTKDISPGGMFVISSQSLPVGTLITIKIKELDDITPVEAIVRWHQPWGGEQNFPAGFGIQFLILTEDQQRQIKSKLGYEVPLSSLEDIESLLAEKNQELKTSKIK